MGYEIKEKSSIGRKEVIEVEGYKFIAVQIRAAMIMQDINSLSLYNKHLLLLN